MYVEREENGQTVLLKDRAHLELNSVLDVVSFDEGAVLLRTGAGEMTVEGDGLHITTLDLEKGLLAVDGKISALFYSGEGGERKKGSLFARLVK